VEGPDYEAASSAAEVSGPPASACCDCRVVETFEMGKGGLFVGEIVASGAEAEGLVPLIYRAGDY
jgi:flavin reductase (DIM6/NTAB) family NADH-FMN oxidoreductase RutF